MSKQRITFFILAVFTFTCVVLTGIAVAERSFLGAFLALIGVFVLMGTGFSLKKKFREQNER